LVHTAHFQEAAGSNRGNVHDELAASIEGHNGGCGRLLRSRQGEGRE